MKTILIILMALLVYSCDVQHSKVENVETAFITVWDTTIPNPNRYIGYYHGVSGDKEIRLTADKNYKYDYNIDCDNDGYYDAEGVTGDYTCEYDKPGVYTVVITGKFPRFTLPYICYEDGADGELDEEKCSDSFKLTSVKQWGNQKWKSMKGMFADCSNLKLEATDTPDLSGVSSMAGMFSFTNFDSSINNWDVSKVTDMRGLFMYSKYNQPLNNWNVSNVTNMAYMFSTSGFNGDINSWNTANVTNMEGMFEDSDFDKPLNNWNVSKVINMKKMFSAGKFNQNIGNWDVSSVTDMSEMFQYTDKFNQNINGWNVGNVTTISNMFYRAKKFNQPLDLWNVSSVTDMSAAFRETEVFNQDIGKWDVSNVKDMQFMFADAKAFNQDLSSWNVDNVANCDMFRNGEEENSNMPDFNIQCNVRH